ncbi:glycoside hydrolase family 35 protein [Amanita thiersii Skay4041]|uniref:beta-galactosidase n=1 Tax=Amanita thiersii Skay4041 TaxID=703135 RepID=A0A2A9NCV3_9AGAR|nr:glycoside hydrolase family 35 protein [Amanita thiersii Skay4041]
MNPPLTRFKGTGGSLRQMLKHSGSHNTMTSLDSIKLREKPYINAEVAGGGIPGWATNIPGLARTNASDYKEAWIIHGFAEETAPYQYPDGPVIAVQSENEYATSSQAHIPGLDQHMQEIIDTLRQGGITKVPTIHNDKNPSGQYGQKGLGKVDLYGWDGYPLGFDCDRPEVWGELSTQMDTSHQTWNPAEPLALFEWQGGAFSYWSGPGYSDCYRLINEQFANVSSIFWPSSFPHLVKTHQVYYKNNYASGAALQNLYMTYGGTNWGNMHTHTIYSSYDYGAAIREDRTPTPKYDELKLQAYFLHASPDYLLVQRIGNGTVGSGTAYSDSPDIYTTHLHTAQSGVNFYFVRQVTNKKIIDTNFKLKLNATVGGRDTSLVVPQFGDMTLAGRESKIVVSNYGFGTSKLVYSTAEVMTWATFDKVDTVVVYALEGQHIEVALEPQGNKPITIAGSRTVQARSQQGMVIVSGIPSGISIVSIGNARLIIVDKKTAAGFWAPRLQGIGDHTQYDVSPDVPSVLIHGPYLVRDVAVKGSTLALTGDLNTTTTIDIFAPSQFHSITWNGKVIHVTRSELGSLRGDVQFPKGLGGAQVPDLESLQWRCKDSLPELSSDFDDSNWISANKTSTARPQRPFDGKFVLYSSEYGYHSGQWVWRGHFTAPASGVELSIQGGFSFGYSVFLNSHFLGSGQGSSHSQDGVDILSPVFNFTSDQLVDGDNGSMLYVDGPRMLSDALTVLTVIHDSTGMNQDYNINDEHKAPRGIRGYRLISDDGADFIQWRLAGSTFYCPEEYGDITYDSDVGGENAPDHVRGPYNEGGWWFERVGAHLPGFDATNWDACSPFQGINHPGVVAYRTTFELDLPAGSDIPLAFDFVLDSDSPHRVLIYVNGWQFGRFVSTLGPQTSYPIPEGILNHHGQNDVLISLWALQPQGAKLKQLQLNKRATISSSKSAKVNVVDAPNWQELRRGSTTN